MWKQRLTAFARQTLLAAYYYADQPLRRWSARRRAREGSCPVSVIFYHRVADTYPNDWTISTQAFAQQIDWLERHFELVSLAEAQARLRSRCNRRPAVAITFDDGYADNCHFALPLLVRRAHPGHLLRDHAAHSGNRAVSARPRPGRTTQAEYH